MSRPPSVAAHPTLAPANRPADSTAFVTASTAPRQVSLFVNHLASDDDDALLSEMAAYGDVVRAFVVRAPAEDGSGAPGRSKGYGFVEFAVPSGAKAALRALEERYDAERKRLRALEDAYYDERVRCVRVRVCVCVCLCVCFDVDTAVDNEAFQKLPNKHSCSFG
jgi:RNA recognition motif-containing protein